MRSSAETKDMDFFDLAQWRATLFSHKASLVGLFFLAWAPFLYFNLYPSDSVQTSIRVKLATYAPPGSLGSSDQIEPVERIFPTSDEVKRKFGPSQKPAWLHSLAPSADELSLTVNVRGSDPEATQSLAQEIANFIISRQNRIWVKRNRQQLETFNRQCVGTGGGTKEFHRIE